MQKAITFLLIISIATLTLVSTAVHLLTESWWFETLGLTRVFWLRIVWQVSIWLSTVAIYGAFLGFNYWLALRLTGDRRFRFLESSEFEPYTNKIANYLIALVIFFTALSVANLSAASWELFPRFINATEFKRLDP
ncbi:MAG: hypothetical protein RLZZ381_3528, partial [Cyanobacteriota bacterium]